MSLQTIPDMRITTLVVLKFRLKTNVSNSLRYQVEILHTN